MQGRGVQRASIIVAVVAMVLLVVAFRGFLSRAMLAGAIDAASGYRVAFDRVALGSSSAEFDGTRVAFAGAPLLAARRVVVRYDLHQLFFGGTHRYGLLAVVLDEPQLTLRRAGDGSFGLQAAARGPQRVAPTSVAAPLAWTLEVRRGSVTVLDPARALADARRIEVRDITARATIDEAARTHYRIHANLAVDSRQSFTLAGSVDARRGYGMHHFTARALDATAIANYFINTPAAAVSGAMASNVDVYAYALAAPTAWGPYHLTGSTTLSGGAMAVPGLVPQARDMRGRIYVFDRGLAAPLLRARLGPLDDVRLAGGLYGWNAPAFRLGVRADAPLSQLRTLFRFSQALPLEGRARLTTLVEGSAGRPLVATSVVAPHITYGAYPIDAVAGRALLYSDAVDVVGARGVYAGLGVTANGAIRLGSAVSTQLVVGVAGPVTQVPYLAEVAPGLRIVGGAVVAGTGLRLDARGALVDDGRTRTAARGPASSAVAAASRTTFTGVFHVDPYGDGALGPVALTAAGGASLGGTFYLRRSVSESGFWLDARDYPYADLASVPHLPGIALTAPAFSGRLEGTLAGVGPPSAFRVAGNARARDLRVGTLRIDEVRGSVAGALGNLRLANVAAHGHWGGFDGRGTYRAGRLALQGNYRGSFDELATLTGDLGAKGSVAGPVSLLIDPKRTVVQTPGVATAGARVRGLALDGAAGTLGVENGRLRIYGATASIAGGTLAAAGRLDGDRGLGLSLGDVAAKDAFAVKGVDPGRFTAIGDVSLAGRSAVFAGGLAVGVARVQSMPAAANGDVTLSPGAVRIADGSARIGSAIGSVGGLVTGAGTSRQAYDLDVAVRAAQLGPFAQVLFPGRTDIVGTANARFGIRGTAGAPQLSGTFAIPEGIVNGLPFGDAGAHLVVDRMGFAARDGMVTVGSTRAAFSGSARGSDTLVRLSAPRTDLADFNDFFDAGDTLGGRGSIAADFHRGPRAATTSADIAIAALHYRRFDLGDARAVWTSSGEVVRGHVLFGGPSGTLATAGIVRLDTGAPLTRLVARSRFDGTARLRGLDLGVWLPVLGYHVPLTGRIDADATVAGRLANPDFRTQATILGGSIGPFPIDRFSLEASSTLRRTTIRRAELELPALGLAASGTLGFGEHDPLALQIHAKSPNLGSLATRLFDAHGTVNGAAEADIKIDGTRHLPRVTGGFDVENATLRGVAVPRALGEFSLRGRDVVLSDVEVGFGAGQLDLAGSVPFEISPFRFGPAAAPVALQAALRGIDLASFLPLLPAGSTLAGRLEGGVAIVGTAGSPQLGGAVTLSGGKLRTPGETVPLEDVAANVSFAGTTATVDRLQAAAGGGRLEARGAATFADLVRPQSAATYAFRASATRVRLDFPAYGSGQLDGFLTLEQRPRSLPVLGGDVSLSEATIPFAALLAGSGASGPGDSAPPLPFAFDFDVDADRNVRVRSANVDIGARGSLHVAGTRAAPSLDGRFTSTGGTLTYFNTIFRLLEGAVTFSPESGVVPTLEALAVTHVTNPDPNEVRNAAGTADVSLAVSGPVTNPSITLSSDPPYDRQQILGLLLNAPALGASNLFGETAQNPTLYGSNATAGVPSALTTSRNTSGQLSVAQEAFGIANAQFTRALLAPIESTVAEAVGLTNLDVNVNYTGSVGVEARKLVGKKVNALFGTSFGYPYRQTFGFEVKPNPLEAAQVTVFQTLGATGVSSLTPTTSLTGANTKLQAAQPTAGTIGFSLSLQRLFP